MSSNNKGRFKDRLKKMKLYRIAKLRNMVLINGVLKTKNKETSFKIFGTLKIYNNNLFSRDSYNIKNVAISGISVGTTLLGTVINIEKNVDSDRKTEIIKDNKKVDKKDRDNNISNKVKSGLSVGVAVVGTVVTNMVGKKDGMDKENKTIAESDKKTTYKEDAEVYGEAIDSKDTIDIRKIIDNMEEKQDMNKINNAINNMRSGLAVGAAVASKVVNNNNMDYEKKSDKKIRKNNDNSGRGIYKAGNDYILVDKISDKDIIDGNKKTYLANQIIKKIKKQYEKKLSEIEVLESGLYLLDEKSRNELDLEKCKKIRKEINDMIKKINHIIEQYNIYKSFNFDIDMLDIDDKTLVDDISDFKRIYETADIKRRLVSDYELISEYQSLYYNLNNIRDDVISLEKNTDKKINDLDNRDKKVENITKDLFNIDEVCEDSVNFLNDQNDYLNSIFEKINHIDVDHVANYRLNGFTNLLFSSVRYLGLLSLSPLAGFVPGIAISTLATRNMIHNLRNSLSIDRITSTVYRAEDFRFELNKKLYDIDYNANVIDMSLDEIKDLKKEFLNQYNYKIDDHHKILSNINKIESSLYRQKDKLSILKKKMEISKKSNEETLNKVKVLEKNSKPIVERNV